MKLLKDLIYSRDTIFFDDINVDTFTSDDDVAFISYLLLRLYGRHTDLPKMAWSYNEWEQQQFENWRKKNDLPMNSIKDEEFFGVLHAKTTKNLYLQFPPIIISHSIFVKY